MIEKIGCMQSLKVSTLMYVDLSQRPPLPSTCVMLYLWMIYQRSVGSTSCRRKTRNSPIFLSLNHLLRKRLEGEGRLSGAIKVVSTCQRSLKNYVQRKAFDGS